MFPKYVCDSLPQVDADKVCMFVCMYMYVCVCMCMYVCATAFLRLMLTRYVCICMCVRVCVCARATAFLRLMLTSYVCIHIVLQYFAPRKPRCSLEALYMHTHTYVHMHVFSRDDTHCFAVFCS
jgi:hypothetical protein